MGRCAGMLGLLLVAAAAGTPDKPADMRKRVSARTWPSYGLGSPRRLPCVIDDFSEIIGSRATLHLHLFLHTRAPSADEERSIGPQCVHLIALS
jgi:hypothetical protein